MFFLANILQNFSLLDNSRKHDESRFPKIVGIHFPKIVVFDFSEFC